MVASPFGVYKQDFEITHVVFFYIIFPVLGYYLKHYTKLYICNKWMNI